MSLSTFVCLMFGVGMYKLGAFNQQHPGEAWRATQHAWSWVAKSWK